jgi:hypothetical protein
MASLGLTPEQAQAMAEMLCAVEQATAAELSGALAKAREANRKRQQRWRERRVTLHNVTNGYVTDARVEDNLLTTVLAGKDITVSPVSNETVETVVKGQPLTCETHSKKRAEERKRLLEFAEGWNTLAGELRLPQIEEIGSGSMRERHALARLRQMPTTDFLWPFIRGSPYLRGEVNGFRCTFDWIINAANFEKIRDGNYADRQERPREINFLARR